MNSKFHIIFVSVFHRILDFKAGLDFYLGPFFYFIPKFFVLNIIRLFIFIHQISVFICD